MCAPRVFKNVRTSDVSMCVPRILCVPQASTPMVHSTFPRCVHLEFCVRLGHFNVGASGFENARASDFCVCLGFYVCRAGESTPMGFSKVLYVRLEFLCASRTFQWRASEFSSVRTSDIMCAAGEHPHSPIGCSTSCIAQRRLHRQFFMWCAHRPEINSKQKISHRNQCHPHIYPTMLDHSTDMHHTPLVWNTGDSFLGRRASGSWDASVSALRAV